MYVQISPHVEMLSRLCRICLLYDNGILCDQHFRSATHYCKVMTVIRSASIYSFESLMYALLHSCPSCAPLTWLNSRCHSQHLSSPNLSGSNALQPRQCNTI